LTYSFATANREWRFVNSRDEPETVHVSGRFSANNGDVLRVVALKDEGIISVPLYIVETDLDAGRLVRILSDYEPIETPVSAVYPQGRFVSASVRSFVDFLAAHLSRAIARRPAQAAPAPAIRQAVA
jgi:DNA-binding transcriptional LysR family regulator